ncbi:MAG: sulfatase-like hydrolase/transferase, partial [Planctomycetota bacterium]
MPAATRPTNILLIHSDQHRFDCLGVNGHPQLKTPNLDRLAREGTNFTHAFTPNPVCSPARACLQTGAWATTHRVLTITSAPAYQPASPELPVLTKLLANADYRVAHVGKFHGEVAGGPTDHGAETYVPAGGYRQWRQEQGLPPVPATNGWFGETDPHITPEQSALHWQCDQTLKLLDDFGSTANDRPFFLRWDPPEPHLPNVVPEPYAGMISPELIEPWPGFPDDLAGKPHVQKKSRVRWGTDDWDWAKWQSVVARYFGEIMLLDHQVGRLLDKLDELGLADSTLVVYTTDHGDMCGSHGMMDKHYNLYDDIMRVPLIARLPGKLKAGATCDRFVAHEMDMAKTFLDVAGIDAPESFIGRDLIDEADGVGEGRPDIFGQYHGTHQGLYSERMLRD